MLILEVIAVYGALQTVGGAIMLYMKKRNEHIASFVTIDPRNSDLRGRFNEIPIEPASKISGHTHAVAAANRTSAVATMTKFASVNGYKPYFWQMSRKNQIDGHDGNRTYYWSKDFNAEQRDDPVKPEHIVCMVDVDYYMDDFESVMVNMDRPVMLYTFQPTKAAAVMEDYSFTFDKDNQVRYLVAGGGEYNHHVYNYAADTLVCRKTFMGLTYKKAYFTIEKRKIDDHHQLIFLTPLAKCGLIGSFLTAWYLKENELKRLNVVDGDFARLDVMITEPTSGECMMRSTCPLGRYCEQTVPVQTDDALAKQAVLTKGELSAFTVKSMSKDVNVITDEGAVCLVAYHRQKQNLKVPERVVIPSDSVFNYSFTTNPFVVEKPGVIPYMNPIITGCCAPTQCIENDEAMVQQRIKDVKPKRGKLGNKLREYANEFAEEFLKRCDKQLIPCEFEDVDEKLNRPSQRVITEEASWWGARFTRKVKSFMKKESYGKFAAPRPIATINGNDKTLYSKFTYSLSEATKQMSWYAFGKKPRQIGERVAHLAKAAKWLAMTDLSKFDGRVSESIREFEEIFMHVVFNSAHHSEMERMMKTQFNLNAVSSNGVRYKCLFGRLSGSPETAVYNSLVNAWMAYITYRMMGKQRDDAWGALGIYGGDDGITPDVDKTLYESVCDSLGQRLECEIIHRGKPKVNFLSRYYGPLVWNGDESNCCDIKRALQKIHVTTAVALDPQEKLFEKCYALWLTDRKTPIIGAFVSTVVEMQKAKDPNIEFKNRLANWNANTTNLDEQYINEDTDFWMHDLLEEQLPEFNLAGFEKWLLSCRSLSMVMQCPKLMDTQLPQPADVDIKVNDDLLRASKPKVPVVPKGFTPNQPTPPATSSVVTTKYVLADNKNKNKNCKNKNNNKNKPFRKNTTGATKVAVVRNGARTNKVMSKPPMPNKITPLKYVKVVTAVATSNDVRPTNPFPEPTEEKTSSSGLCWADMM